MYNVDIQVDEIKWQWICVAAKKAFIVNFKAEFLGKNDKVSFPLYFCIFVFFSLGRGLVDTG